MTSSELLENLSDDLVAIRILAEDIDEWADDPENSALQATWLLSLLQGKTLQLLSDLSDAFELVKKSENLLDASPEAR